MRDGIIGGLGSRCLLRANGVERNEELIVDSPAVALNTIGTQQATATEATNEAITQLLDYMATYPDDGIVYRSSNMILAAHANAGFHNESKGRS